MPEESERVRDSAAKPSFDDYRRPEAERPGELPAVPPAEAADLPAGKPAHSWIPWGGPSREDMAVAGVLLGGSAAFELFMRWKLGYSALPIFWFTLGGLAVIGLFRMFASGSLRPSPPEIPSKGELRAKENKSRGDLLFSGAALTFFGLLDVAASVAADIPLKRGLMMLALGVGLLVLRGLWSKLSPRDPE